MIEEFPMKHTLWLIVGLVLASGCGSAPSGTSPSPLVNTATLSISNFTVTASAGASPGTFDDRMTFHLVESGTVGLTFTHLTFTLLPLGAVTTFQPGAFIAAGGTLDPVYTLTGAPSSPQMRVDIAFIDDHGLTGAATATANITSQ